MSDWMKSKNAVLSIFPVDSGLQLDIEKTELWGNKGYRLCLHSYIQCENSNIVEHKAEPELYLYGRNAEVFEEFVKGEL